jgi:predicted ATP-grasp superfamily ATP-dependent carboligase
MPILVVAIAGRALAVAARRAGEEVAVADFFGDVDTRAIAPWLELRGDLTRGIERGQFRAMAQALPGAIEGVVYGAGFERNPELLCELAGIAPLIGNAPDCVASVKDPWSFAALLEELGLPHPRISARPGPGTDWLRKRRGGSGGTHIRRVTSASAETDDGFYYYQQLMTGRASSALFVADGREARLLGFSEQWSAPSGAAPFRYGGCAAPEPVEPIWAQRIAAACTAIVAATGLVGLNSLDMLVEGDAFTVLEVNPRPGATLDVFDGAGDASLWRLHRASVAGDLPPRSFQLPVSPARAAAIVYALEDSRVPDDVAPWSDGIADVPQPDSIIRAGAPVCTVFAEGRDVGDARGRVCERADAVLRRLTPLSQSVAELA